MSAKGRAILSAKSKSQESRGRCEAHILSQSTTGGRESGEQQIQTTGTEKETQESKSQDGAHTPPPSDSQSTAGGRESGGQQIQASEKEGMQNKMNTLMVVSALIVTVTFAAGFTAPGGLYGDDVPDPRNRGMAILGHKLLFKMFVALNTVAMYSSTFGTYLLLGAMIGKFRFCQAYRLALFLVCFSLLLMVLAFMSAASLVVSNIRWLAGFIIYLGFVSFYFIVSSSNPYMFFLVFFGLRMYWIKSFKLLLDFLNPLCWKHQSSDSEHARCKPKFLRRYL